MKIAEDIPIGALIIIANTETKTEPSMNCKEPIAGPPRLFSLSGFHNVVNKNSFKDFLSTKNVDKPFTATK